MSRTASMTVHVYPESKARVDTLAKELGCFRSVLLADLINEGARSRAKHDPSFAVAFNKVKAGQS